jgi:hypothetical protein
LLPFALILATQTSRTTGAALCRLSHHLLQASRLQSMQAQWVPSLLPFALMLATHISRTTGAALCRLSLHLLQASRLLSMQAQ